MSATHPAPSIAKSKTSTSRGARGKGRATEGKSKTPREDPLAAASVSAKDPAKDDAGKTDAKPKEKPKIDEIKPVTSGFATDALRFAFPVAKGSAEQRHAASFGFCHREVPAHPVNPHGPSAFTRLVATAYTLGSVLDDGYTAVVDVFGNNRTAAVYAQLRGSDDKRRWMKELSIIVVGDKLVPADTRRRDPESVSTPDCAVLLTNVYDSHSTALDPRAIASHCLEHKATAAYVLTHRFPDACGVLDAHSAYLRTVDGRVLYRPSLEEEPYGPHAANDWALADGGITLGPGRYFQWTKLRSFASLHLFKFSFSETPIIAATPLPQNNGFRSVALPDRSTWYGWASNRILDHLPVAWRSTLGRAISAPLTMTLVDTRLVAIATRALRGVRLNDTTKRTVINTLYRELDKDPYATIIQAFPGHLVNGRSITDAFIDGALFTTISEIHEQEHNLLADYNALHGNMAASRTVEIGRIGTAPPPWNPYPVTTAIGLTILAAAIYYVRVRRHNNFLHPNWPRLSAFAEETLRFGAIPFFGPILSAVIFCALDCVNWYCRNDAPTFPEVATCLVGHGLMTAFHCVIPSPFGFALATVAHIAWNRSEMLPPPAPVSPWQTYKRVFLEGPIADVPEQTSEIVRATPVDDIRVLDRTDVRTTHAEAGFLVDIDNDDICNMLDAAPTESYHYAVLPTNAPHFVPGRSGPTYVAMILRRLGRANAFEEDFQNAMRKYLSSWNSGQLASEREFNAPTLGHVYGQLCNRWRETSWYVLKLLKNSTDEITELVASSYDNGELLQADWLDHLKSNKAKLTNVARKTANIDLQVKPIQDNMKRDEKLFRRDDHNRLDVLARIIQAVPSNSIVAVGPAIWANTNAMKYIFSVQRLLDGESHFMHVHDCKSFEVFIIQGPIGDLDMSRAVTRSANMDSPHVVIVVAGDDNLNFGRSTTGDYFCTEGDFSLFDSSQFGPSLAFESRWLLARGVPKHIVAQLMYTNSMDEVVPYKRAGTSVPIGFHDIRDHNFHEVYDDNEFHELPNCHPLSYVDPRVRRRTGGSDTTDGGSGVTLALNLIAICTKGLDFFTTATTEEVNNHLIGVARTHGMKLKCRSSSGPSPDAYVGHTFLKHVILPLTTTVPAPYNYIYGACPLPSRILKIGLTVTDPRVIYRRYKFKGDAAVCDLFLADQAAGLRDAFLLPPLDAFVARHYDRKRSFQEFVDPRAQYKAQVQEGLFMGIHKSQWKPYLPAFYKWAYERYQMSFEDVAQVSALAASPARTFIEHPAFERMARADYA
jgi:hypothetical protein